MRTEALTWIGIAFCIAQSAFFAGLNLAIFSVSRLRLEVEAAGGQCQCSQAARAAQRFESHLGSHRMGERGHECASHASIRFGAEGPGGICLLQQKRIITGADLLGRLLRGIATQENPATAPVQHPP
jgi:hypothetical protein